MQFKTQMLYKETKGGEKDENEENEQMLTKFYHNLRICLMTTSGVTSPSQRRRGSITTAKYSSTRSTKQQMENATDLSYNVKQLKRSRNLVGYTSPMIEAKRLNNYKH
eukprot:3145659-Amphidinium_carterae.1